MGVAYNSRIITDGLVLALDAANKKSFYGYWSGSYGTAANAFDGNLSTFSGGAGGTFSATYTFNNGLDVSGTVRVYVTFGAGSGQVNGRTGVILVDGNDISSKMAAANVYASSPGWVDVTSEVGSIFNTVVLNGTGGSTNPSIAAIEVNGQILVGTTWAGTTWGDMSTNGNNGTLVNGVGYSASNGGSLSFDGSNQQVTKSSATINFSGGTMEVWAYFNNFNGNQGVFSMSSPPTYINFYIPTSKFMRWEVIGNTGSPYSTISSTYVIEPSTWYHFVGTFGEGNTTKLYINGVLNNSQSSYTNVPSNFTSSIILGEYAGYLNGRISNAKIYNRALTAAEISQNFNALRGRFSI